MTAKRIYNSLCIFIVCVGVYVGIKFYTYRVSTRKISYKVQSTYSLKHMIGDYFELTSKGCCLKNNIENYVSKHNRDFPKIANANEKARFYIFFATDDLIQMQNFSLYLPLVFDSPSNHKKSFGGGAVAYANGKCIWHGEDYNNCVELIRQLHRHHHYPLNLYIKMLHRAVEIDTFILCD